MQAWAAVPGPAHGVEAFTSTRATPRFPGFKQPNYSSELGETVTSACEDPVTVNILERIQSYVFQRRVRVREGFFSFDPLHTGRCTID
jgi:hypothetical protein